MIYLTRISTDTVQIARCHLGDNYSWHRELWKAFPGREEEKRDFLFRLDRRERFLTVWILSATQPTPLAWGCWDTKVVTDSFLKHKRYQFLLRANPTVMRVVRLEDGTRRKNGRRTTIYNAEELRQWLDEKAGLSGFTVDQVAFDPPVKEYFLKGKTKGVHARVDFSGILSVIDFEKFASAWQNGIGPARAFGFGLLLLSPVE
ncbi:MAG: type I-E CRISPR-associated protein Cas6/Cse3/CasE [Planctomycetia bacterium]|nr:type I-E CRISPR-associated protein Cas6/Cse3/CasE [Planctomycetia bacterium]